MGLNSSFSVPSSWSKFLLIKEKKRHWVSYFWTKCDFREWKFVGALTVGKTVGQLWREVLAWLALPEARGLQVILKLKTAFPGEKECHILKLRHQYSPEGHRMVGLLFYFPLLSFFLSEMDRWRRGKEHEDDITAQRSSTQLSGDLRDKSDFLLPTWKSKATKSDFCQLSGIYWGWGEKLRDPWRSLAETEPASRKEKNPSKILSTWIEVKKCTRGTQGCSAAYITETKEEQNRQYQQWIFLSAGKEKRLINLFHGCSLGKQQRLCTILCKQGSWKSSENECGLTCDQECTWAVCSRRENWVLHYILQY